MVDFYITRTLILNRGRRDEETITESDIPSIDAPIVILGDPGLGKTELSETLERQFGYNRVAGGAFYRNQNNARYATPLNSKLIIDGLDEIAAALGVSPIDEVLNKWVTQISSCRADPPIGRVPPTATRLKRTMVQSPSHFIFNPSLTKMRPRS